MATSMGAAWTRRVVTGWPRPWRTAQRAAFRTTAVPLDRHPRSFPPEPYVPPPPFPPPTASAQTLLDFRDPPASVHPVEDPLLAYLTNLIMREGKRARAQQHVRLCLQHLRFVTGQEPLPLLRKAVELAAPNVRLMNERKKIRVTTVPVPLNERQRVRKAIVWMIKYSERRQDRRFGARLALEIVAVLNGNSEALKQKTDLHRQAVVNRSSLRTTGR